MFLERGPLFVGFLFICRKRKRKTLKEKKRLKIISFIAVKLSCQEEFDSLKSASDRVGNYNQV